MSGVDAEWSSVHADFLRFQSDAPALYDFLMSYGLTWPSLSAQWLPVEPVRSAGSVTHQMLFGTYTPPSCQSARTGRRCGCNCNEQGAGADVSVQIHRSPRAALRR
jgi:hypothetical protein